MTDVPEVAAPPARFNFAQHLLEQNAARASKLAFADGKVQRYKLREREAKAR